MDSRPDRLIVLVGGFVGIGYLSHRADQKRLADLTLRFGTQVAGRIVKKMTWQCATPEMIIESIGEPLDVDEKAQVIDDRALISTHRRREQQEHQTRARADLRASPHWRHAGCERR